jgi:hypothetical protein
VTAVDLKRELDDICKQDLDLSALTPRELVRLYAKFERASERSCHDAKVHAGTAGDLAVLGCDVGDVIVSRMMRAAA